MDPRDAVLTVLREAGEPLHRTVIQDRALRAGYVDPFVTRDIPREFAHALQALLADGTIVRTAKGVYAPAAAGSEESPPG